MISGQICLLFILGLVIGAVGVLVINHFKGVNANKKAEQLLEKARHDAEKNKRDSVLEAKEEIHKLKMEAEREIKEKKQEGCLMLCYK